MFSQVNNRRCVRRIALLMVYVRALRYLLVAIMPCLAQAESLTPNIVQETELSYLPGVAGEYFTVPAKRLGRDFHVFVKLPESYDQETSKTYPTVYVLDGESLFPILAPTHMFLEYDYDLPEAIIVGITYGSFDPSVNMRGYDFSPKDADNDASRGGAPDFQAFLKSELLPAVEQRFRVDENKRVLFGQSRGGGFVMYSAFTDPDLFWARIASNPTFEPGKELFFSDPPAASNSDLRLVVTSGSADLPYLRAAAVEWFSALSGKNDLPWQLKTQTIQGGRHASFAPTSYRTGMLWLFGIEKD